ncbi:glutamyl-tRNA reductase [Legionella parisiensis]|nr:glutamyl-tRNA reductase [Legionella parisiensis]
MMFVVCGLNHKTAPINVREKVASSSTIQDFLLHSLLSLPDINEAAILSTCNRTEIYCDTHNPRVLSSWLAQTHQLPVESLAPFLYLHQNDQGIKHTLRVASGLDSMMIGEPQILGQMKQAYQQACNFGAIKTKLRPIFETIFSASKRVRTQSGIGINPVSIAYAAVQLIGRFFKDYKSLNVLLIGSGETASLVTKYLHQQGVHRFLIASRTIEHAQKLAKDFNGKAIALHDLSHFLPQADVIVSATTCPIPFINKRLVEEALSQRNDAPMFFLDLAVPRDIEPQINELAPVYLYNIDDLQVIIEKGMDERHQAALHAEQLIEDELNLYIQKQRALKAKNLICDYRNQMHHLAQKELEQALKKLSSGLCQQSVLNELSERLVSQLMNIPTAMSIRHRLKEDHEEVMSLAHYLFSKI